MTNKDEFTLEDIEADLLIAAELVDKYGPRMQPLLDRVEKEYEARKNATSATDRIKRMLGKN